MSRHAEAYIKSKLDERIRESNFRSFARGGALVDFTSNDYLGFARNTSLKEKTVKEFNQYVELGNGSTGSRLLSGNSVYAESLEEKIASFHCAETALLFNSGFDTNYGLFSTLPYRGHTLLYDEAVHASIHDGMRNCKAECIPFLHNHVDDLEAKLEQTEGVKYVVVESLYSMHGDFAPIKQIAAVCTKYDAALIVDEAHATGIYGTNGNGLVCESSLADACFARIFTYGKAAGASGACIVGSKTLKDFLINYCRPLIFSTAMMPYQWVSISNAYRQFAVADEERSKLFDIIDFFRKEMQSAGVELRSADKSPIQIIPVSGNRNVIAVAKNLVEAGFDVRPIKYPTVKKGDERLRICLHSYNSAEQVASLVLHLSKYWHA